MCIEERKRLGITWAPRRDPRHTRPSSRGQHACFSQLLVGLQLLDVEKLLVEQLLNVELQRVESALVEQQVVENTSPRLPALL